MKRPIDDLTTTSYLVLGLVAMSGGCTSYEMKREVERSIGNFWSFPHTSLYSEPSRLVDEGFLEERQEPEGRRRRFFAITEAGREALSDWLGDPTSPPPELRYPALLKLFFSGLAEDSLVDLARQQAEAHAESLVRFRTMLEANATRLELRPQLKTLELGIAFNEAALAFWQSLITEDDGYSRDR